MTAKLYIAYHVVLENRVSRVNTDKHLTMCFMDAKEAKYLPIPTLGTLVCKDFCAEYWPGPNITVIVVKDDSVKREQESLSKLGYTYTDYEFKPHITMAEGDRADNINMLLKGCTQIRLQDPYLTVKDFG